MHDPLVAQVGFVALVADVADEVRPRNAVRASDQPRVRDRPEGLAHIRGVGDVAVRAQEDGSETACVCRVADVGLGGLFRTAEKCKWVKECQFFIIYIYIYIFFWGGGGVLKTKSAMWCW